MGISTELCKVKLNNPTVLAAGMLGESAAILQRVANSGAGAVTMKSIGPEYRPGHNNPTVIANENYVMNAIGLPSPGYKNIIKEWDELSNIDVPLILSIYGGSIDEFKEVAKNIAKLNPELLEVNISCPNSEKHGQVFGTDPIVAEEVISTVKKETGNIPVLAKLSPNCLNIASVAKACELGGADGITAINTVGPGMAINIEAKKPVLHFKTGGLSGPAIKPIAVRCIYDIYKTVNIPILGMGGVTIGKDAIELMMAGASAVGIGSGVYYRGIDIFKKVNEEIKEWMKKNKYSSISEIIGAAHE